MAAPSDRVRSEAARKLFAYTYSLRYGRQPYPWEMTLGQALLIGELQVCRPPETQLLRRIHLVVEDVSLALRGPEEKAEPPAGECDGAMVRSGYSWREPGRSLAKLRQILEAIRSGR